MSRRPWIRRAEVGEGRLGLLALGAHGADVGQGPRPDAVEVGAAQECGWDRRWGSASGPIVLPWPGDRAGAARRGVPVDGPTHDGGPRDGPEGAAVGTDVGRVAFDLDGCRAAGRRSATRLIRTRSGRRGSRRATTCPGLGPKRRRPREPDHHQAVTGEEGRGHRRPHHLDPAERAVQPDEHHDHHRRQGSGPPDPAGTHRSADHQRQQRAWSGAHVRPPTKLGKVSRQGTMTQSLPDAHPRPCKEGVPLMRIVDHATHRPRPSVRSQGGRTPTATFRAASTTRPRPESRPSRSRAR